MPQREDNVRPIRVVIVDDHPLLRDGTRTALQEESDIDVIGLAGDGSEALRLVETHQPDVLILDLRLPDMSGVSVAERVRTSFPDTAVLVLTGFDDIGYTRALMRLDIQGYLRKTASAAQIIDAVRTIAAGKTVPVVGEMRSGAHVPLDFGAEALSPREHEVLKLLAAGRRNSEIGSMLGLSAKTVEFHITHVLKKLNARSRTEAVLKGREQGLVLLDYS